MRIEVLDKQKNSSKTLQELREIEGLEYRFILMRVIEEIIAHVFIDMDHSLAFAKLGGLEKADSFIGAGIGITGSSVRWGSITCRGMEGLLRDRPRDPEEADRLLSEFRQSITSLLSSPS